MARHLVGNACDIAPGSLQRVEVAGQAVCVARSDKGDFFAIPDRCTHEDYPLSDGSIWGEGVARPAATRAASLRSPIAAPTRITRSVTGPFGTGVWRPRRTARCLICAPAR